MTLKEQYQKETRKSPYLLRLNDGELVTTEYIEWLEAQIPLREQAAWDAALKWDSNNEAYYYHDIEEWRNSR